MLRHVERERRYADRAEAGAVLAEALTQQLAAQLTGPTEDRPLVPDLLVLGLPRGGVPVAAPVAAALAAPLDVLLVRKVGVPGHRELAMGAIAVIGDRCAVVRNEPELRDCLLSSAEFTEACRAELDTLQQQAVRYRGDRQPLEVAGRLVVVVDDGLATGATMRAAIAALRGADAERLVVAAPIGSPGACQELAAQVDLLVCPWQPSNFYAVSQGYRDFSQTTDAAVIQILAGSR